MDQYCENEESYPLGTRRACRLGPHVRATPGLFCLLQQLYTCKLVSRVGVLPSAEGEQVDRTGASPPPRALLRHLPSEAFMTLQERLPVRRCSWP